MIIAATIWTGLLALCAVISGIVNLLQYFAGKRKEARDVATNQPALAIISTDTKYIPIEPAPRKKLRIEAVVRNTGGRSAQRFEVHPYCALAAHEKELHTILPIQGLNDVPAGQDMVVAIELALPLVLEGPTCTRVLLCVVFLWTDPAAPKSRLFNDTYLNCDEEHISALHCTAQDLEPFTESITKLRENFQRYLHPDRE